MYWASNSVIFYDQIQVLITFSLAIFVNTKERLFRDEQHSEKKTSCVELIPQKIPIVNKINLRNS